MTFEPLKPSMDPPLFVRVSKRFHDGENVLPQRIRQFLKNWCLIPFQCDTFLCQKSPGRAFKFRSKFLLDFLAKTSKVPPLCQSCLSNSWRQGLFWLSNHQGIPATPTHLPLGGIIDRCITLQFSWVLGFKLPEFKDSHKILDEIKFWPDQTIYVGVTCL